MKKKLTFLAVDFDGCVGSDYGERDSFFERLLTSVFVLVFGVGKFVDFDAVLRDFIENGLFKRSAFVRRQSVRFGDQRDNVHFVVKSFHEFNVERLQPGRGEEERGKGGEIISSCMLATLQPAMSVGRS